MEHWNTISNSNIFETHPHGFGMFGTSLTTDLLTRVKGMQLSSDPSVKQVDEWEQIFWTITRTHYDERHNELQNIMQNVKVFRSWDGFPWNRKLFVLVGSHRWHTRNMGLHQTENCDWHMDLMYNFAWCIKWLENDKHYCWRLLLLVFTYKEGMFF